MNVHQRLMMGYGAAASTARPEFVAVASSTVFGTGALSVALPAGWSAGQLAILHIASGAAMSIPAGWTAIGSEITNGTGKSNLCWRILQSGDSGPTLVSSANVSAIVWTFREGTFNSASPVSQIATFNSSGGLSTGHTVPASSSVSAGEHYVLHIDSWNSSFATVSAYPYAFAQHTRGVGSAPTYTGNMGAGSSFNGGVSAGTSFTVSANVPWVGRKIAIIGKGFAP